MDEKHSTLPALPAGRSEPAATDQTGTEEPSPPMEPEAPPEEETGHVLDGNYRKVYESEFHQFPVDMRLAAARAVSGVALMALCLDPEPKVIHAVLENALVGLDHARLIAAHHHNPAGLEAVAARSQFLRDGQVQRNLLRNHQATDGLLRKMLGSGTLLQLFKLTVSREITERAKRMSRETLRHKFAQGNGEECAGLIFTTEGRCLGTLIGMQFDSKTTALLCRRTYNSTLLIQNLARFPGTPPAVVKHMLMQPLVKRSPHLKQLLLKHSNCPTEVKKLLV